MQTGSGYIHKGPSGLSALKRENVEFREVKGSEFTKQKLRKESAQ